MHVKDLGQNNLLIHNCVISYPTLFVPRRAGRPGQETGEPAYSANFILPELDAEDQATIGRVFQAAIQQRWPNGDFPKDANGNFSVPPDKNCFKAAHEKFPGRMVISARSAQDKPPLVDINGMQATKEQASQIFAGCIVNAHLRLFAYTKGSNGISAALNGVQLVDNMNVERLDNTMDSAKVFGTTRGSGFPAPSAPPPTQPGPAVPASQQVQPGVPQPQPANPAAPAPGMPPQPWNS